MSKGKKLTIEEFKQRSIEIHQNKFDYSKVIYINGTTKVEIICSKHGSFFQYPQDHLQGNGCLFCHKENLKSGIYSRKYFLNKDVLYNEDANSYYLLGAFISDGCVDKRFNYFDLSSKDFDWLVKIGKLLISNFDDYNFSSGKNDLRINSRELIKWFIHYGCLSQKSLIVKFPIIPEQYIRDFLRGLLDGDGSISKTHYFHKINNKFYDQYNGYICSSSIELIDGIKNVLDLNNLKYSFSIIKNNKSYFAKENRFIEQKHDHYRISFSERTLYKFCKFIYYENCELFLPRKFNLVKDIFNYYDPIINNPHKNTKYSYPPDEELIKLISDLGYNKTSEILNIHRSSLFYRVKKKKLNIRSNNE